MGTKDRLFQGMRLSSLGAILIQRTEHASGFVRGGYFIGLVVGVAVGVAVTGSGSETGKKPDRFVVRGGGATTSLFE